MLSNDKTRKEYSRHDIILQRIRYKNGYYIVATDKTSGKQWFHHKGSTFSSLNTLGTPYKTNNTLQHYKDVQYPASNIKTLDYTHKYPRTSRNRQPKVLVITAKVREKNQWKEISTSSRPYVTRQGALVRWEEAVESTKARSASGGYDDVIITKVEERTIRRL